MKTTAEEEVYGVETMTADTRVEFQLCLSDSKTQATGWNIADKDRIVSKLEREVYGITSKEQMRFKKEGSISLIQFEAWWQAIGVHELRKTIEQHEIRFGYPNMHVGSHLSVSIWQMGSANNFSTDIFERLHLGNLKVAC